MSEEVKNSLSLIERGLDMVMGTKQDHINFQEAVQKIRIELMKQEQSKNLVASMAKLPDGDTMSEEPEKEK